MSVSYNIKQRREELNMSQEELSLKSGVSRSIISELESGKRVENTTIETIVKISRALDTPIQKIFLN
jgi:DNA-binding helix-turn-helix protein